MVLKYYKQVTPVVKELNYYNVELIIHRIESHIYVISILNASTQVNWPLTEIVRPCKSCNYVPGLFYSFKCREYIHLRAKKDLF